MTDDVLVRAYQLLSEWENCQKVRPMAAPVSLQLEKDSCAKVVSQIHAEFFKWPDSESLPMLCDTFETKLRRLQEQLVIEVLIHGVAPKVAHK